MGEINKEVILEAINKSDNNLETPKKAHIDALQIF